MLTIVLWSVCAMALLACGWFASAWFYRRKIEALRKQHKAARLSAAEHANQARRQIAQLQAEIELRKAAIPAPRRAAAPPAQPAPAAPAARAASNQPVRSFKSDADLVAPAGFSHSAIESHDGFATTQVMV